MMDIVGDPAYAFVEGNIFHSEANLTKVSEVAQTLNNTDGTFIFTITLIIILAILYVTSKKN